MSHLASFCDDSIMSYEPIMDHLSHALSHGIYCIRHCDMVWVMGVTLESWIVSLGHNILDVGTWAKSFESHLESWDKLY